MTRVPASVLVLGAVLATTACATAPDPVGAPDVSVIAVQPSVRAKLYADCIADAVRSERYGYARDGLEVVVFTCADEPAKAFFDALGPWSSTTQSEISVGDRTIRPTTKIERDLFAADYCERAGQTFRCAITLRTGEFARP